jgi:hypothetical protein
MNGRRSCSINSVLKNDMKCYKQSSVIPNGCKCCSCREFVYELVELSDMSAKKLFIDQVTGLQAGIHRLFAGSWQKYYCFFSSFLKLLNFKLCLLNEGHFSS